jgi:hypothetical protein
MSALMVPYNQAMLGAYETAIAVVVGIITVGVFVVRVVWYLKTAIDQINDSVNHRHEKGAGAPKLYDLSWENHKKVTELIEWKRSYDGCPLDRGDKVYEFYKQVEALELRVNEIDEAVKSIMDQIKPST